MHALAKHDTDAWLGRGEQGREAVREEELIGIQPGNPVARRSRQGQVQRVRLSPVRLAGPICARGREQLHRPVLTPAVIDDVFDVYSGLILYAAKTIA